MYGSLSPLSWACGRSGFSKFPPSSDDCAHNSGLWSPPEVSRQNPCRRTSLNPRSEGCRGENRPDVLFDPSGRYSFSSFGEVCLRDCSFVEASLGGPSLCEATFARVL